MRRATSRWSFDRIRRYREIFLDILTVIKNAAKVIRPMNDFNISLRDRYFFLHRLASFGRRACLLAFCFLTLQVFAVTPGWAVQISVGSYVGDGLVGHSITGVGFSPSAVILKGDN